MSLEDEEGKQNSVMIGVSHTTYVKEVVILSEICPT